MNATPRGFHRRLGTCFTRPLSSSRQRLSARVLLGLFLYLVSAVAVRAQIAYAGNTRDFGSVTLGATPSTLDIPFRVLAGDTATITGASAVTQGATLQDFTIASNTCSGTITGPATCTVRVNFSPTNRGLRSGALSLNTTGQSPVVVYIHGIGVGSQLVFAPDTATATSTVTPLSPIFYSPSALVYDAAGNLYFNDFLNSRILEQTSAGTLTTVQSLPGTMMSSMAISGLGTLYVTSPSQAAVYAIVPGFSSTALTLSGGITFTHPSGIAVDGNGAVYIADAAKNQIVRCGPDGTSATVLALTGLARPLSGPEGLAIDVFGDLYIADTGNARIVKVVLSTLAATPVTFTGGLLYNPYGVTTDAAGTLYIADTGNKRILRVNGGAASVILTPNFAFATPTGIVLAPNGDLVVADNSNGLTRILRSTPTTTLTFSTATPIGKLDSADGPKSVTLQNIGNAPLQLTLPSGAATNPSTNNGAFTVASGSTCPQVTSTTPAATAQIASGVACTYAINFTPTVAGANTGSLVIRSTPTGSTVPVTQNVPLAGTGVNTLEAFTITAPATATVGIPVGFTVTALTGGAPSTLYTGTITLSSTDPLATFLNGTTYTFTSADAGVHTFTAPNGIKFGTAGTFTISAKDGAIIGTSNSVLVGGALITPGITLNSGTNPVFLNNSTAVTISVGSTSGTPTGTVVLFDGTIPIASGTLNASGTVTLNVPFSTLGTHNLTATYSGDAKFGTVTSTALAEVVEDFSFVLAPNSPSTVSVFPGSSAQYTFAVAPVGGPTFAGDITFSASGTPAGSTVTFNPAVLPAASGAATTIMTVYLPANSVLLQHTAPAARGASPIALALLLLAPLAWRRGRRRLGTLLLLLFATAALTGLTGCLTDTASGYFGATPRTYTITVTASSGALSHSTSVVLNAQ